MTSLRIETPATLAQRPRTLYDRHRWEEALLAAELHHHNTLLLGWSLAHLAGAQGYLPAGSTHIDRLAKRAHLTSKAVRLSLSILMRAGLVTRPDISTWEPRELTRPITLTMPTGLPHPGGTDD
ncbi:hypothetical protein ACIBAC_29065 [Streptomyces sp. NPDC051362]|uniref:hypothetical protein n=1 Tax=Streptomyces sp. NPDC051362 TaxID=3365651 RepID=UPI0037AF9B47